jgi:hypothetical protein
MALLLYRHSTPDDVWPRRPVQGQPESQLIPRPFCLTSGWAIQISSTSADLALFHLECPTTTVMANAFTAIGGLP